MSDDWSIWKSSECMAPHLPEGMRSVLRYITWVKRKTINHPPVITINIYIYIYRWYVYHSQSWMVYDMVLACFSHITMISPCSQPQGLARGSPGASTQNIPHETSKTSRAQAAESTGTFRRRDKKCRKFMEVQQETGRSTSKWFLHRDFSQKHGWLKQFEQQKPWEIEQQI